MFQTFSMPRFSCIMTECRKAVPDEPRHQRGVLDGIPSPVAAPAEDRVGPVRAEKNSAGQECPGHHGPAAGDVDPFFAGILHDQRAQREGEGDGESDIAQIEHGRMDDHLGILQQRIQAAAVGAQRAFEQAERIGGEIYQQQGRRSGRRPELPRRRRRGEDRSYSAGGGRSRMRRAAGTRRATNLPGRTIAWRTCREREGRGCCDGRCRRW